ncbi:hypothetical protein AYI68_g6622 [Smittium mucronatum]|uniref:Aminodeoxychorismate lyase n=1 Tax=Smittium mucronatum TaxID=133383 RepID=A0A1R0GR06_9FUNG|nr:hypothetical protein AYI68_g6622 [Smittium mucronatum]
MDSYCTECVPGVNSVPFSKRKHSIPENFFLLETTIKHENESEIFLLDKHIARMLDSARYFNEYWSDSSNLNFNPPFSDIPDKEVIRSLVIDQVQKLVAENGSPGSFRVRFLMDIHSKLSVTVSPEPKHPGTDTLT